MIQADRYTLVSQNDTLSMSIEKDKLRIELMAQGGSEIINLNIPQIEFIMDILPRLRAKLS